MEEEITTKLTHSLREQLSEQEHIQWESWTHALSQDLKKIKQLIEDHKFTAASYLIGSILNRWHRRWKPYSYLTEELKDEDRKWADQVLQIINATIINNADEGSPD